MSSPSPVLPQPPGPDTFTTPTPVPVTSRGRPRRRMPIPVAVSIAWLALLLLAIVFDPLLPLPSPTSSDYDAISQPPFQSLDHLLGTDNLGRDILARLIAGARVSLAVGFFSVAIAFVVGTVIGILAGYRGGWWDRVLSWGLDVLLAFPAMIAIIALTAFMGPSLPTVTLGLAVVFIPQVSRIARSTARSFVHRDFVTASKAIGSPDLRIMARDILPNILATVIAFATTLVAVGIVAEGGLSFLGLGVPPPQTSWGSMMGEGRSVLRTFPHVVLIPATVMCITLLAINFAAEWISRRFDTRDSVL